MNTPPIWVRAVVFLVALQCMAGPAMAHTPAEEMAGAAQNLLAALNPEQKAKATFELSDGERLNWHFVPKARKGLTFKEMTPAQRPLAFALLSTGLSQRGYVKATTIMSLEQILLEMEQGKGPARDPEVYYVSIFGKPAENETWGWRVEGHHLSLNFTVAGGRDIAVTPSFLGSNPGEVREGPRKGLRLLGAEEDLARELVKSLTAEQKAIAIYTNTAPGEILTVTNRHIMPLSPDGLALSRMNAQQSALLIQVIEEYIFRYRPEIANQDMEKISKAGKGEIHFAWAGGTDKGEPHYYRVQGPTFLLEYDNTQNKANHIHAVWRDFQGDFGEDLLLKHYEQVPHPK